MTDKKEKTPKQKSISERERAETVARAILAQQPQLSKTAPRKEKLAWDQTPTLPGQVGDWIDQLGQHVDQFPPVHPNGQHVPEQLEHILMIMAQWYVRKDGKYYDVEEPGPVLSRDDVERVIIQRLKEEFPANALSNDAVSQLLQVLIKDQFVDPRRSIPIWSGLRQSMPGNTRKLSFKRMVATINTWKAPEYRSLNINKPSWGPFEKYMEVTFPRPKEREMLLNWLAWCLQNEGDKPGWAPFLYSSTKGSGKSTFAKIAGLLFGTQNTATENNINKLVSRFNAPILEKKLVVCEELYVPPGSDKANAIKTFITEKETVAEHKYQAVQQVEQVCAFIFITNHKPIWLEEDDRRFYVIEVDHDGHRWGPNGEAYSKQVASLMDYLQDNNNLAKLYWALMQHNIPVEFDAHSLDVLGSSTSVMQEIRQASGDIGRQIVKEWLDGNGVVAINNVGIKALVKERYISKASAMKYILSDLGWTQVQAKYDGKDYQKSIWLREGYTLKAGFLHHADGWSRDTEKGEHHFDDRLVSDITGYYCRSDLFGKGLELDDKDAAF